MPRSLKVFGPDVTQEAADYSVSSVSESMEVSSDIITNAKQADDWGILYASLPPVVSIARQSLCCEVSISPKREIPKRDVFFQGNSAPGCFRPA